MRYLPRVTHAHTSQSTTPDAVRALFLRDRRTFMCACSWACNCACWAAWAYAADARVRSASAAGAAGGRLSFPSRADLLDCLERLHGLLLLLRSVRRALVRRLRLVRREHRRGRGVLLRVRLLGNDGCLRERLRARTWVHTCA